MLATDAKKRITAEQILGHSWFKKVMKGKKIISELSTNYNEMDSS